MKIKCYRLKHWSVFYIKFGMNKQYLGIDKIAIVDNVIAEIENIVARECVLN